MITNESDLRSKPRVRSFLKGEITHSGGASRTQCTIRDISDTGARIQIPTSVTLPEYFDLYIQMKGLNEKAKIVWINAEEIGVVFLKKAGDLKIEDYADDKVKNAKFESLEVEIYNLKLELAEIRNYINSINIEKKENAA